MEKPEENRLTPGQGLPAPDCSPLIECRMELCHFNAAKKSDCDQCCNAAIGEHIWVKMAGAYEGSSEEAEYYACSKCVTNKYDPEWRSENESSK